MNPKELQGFGDGSNQMNLRSNLDGFISLPDYYRESHSMELASNLLSHLTESDKAYFTHNMRFMLSRFFPMSTQVIEEAPKPYVEDILRKVYDKTEEKVDVNTLTRSPALSLVLRRMRDTMTYVIESTDVSFSDSYDVIYEKFKSISGLTDVETTILGDIAIGYGTNFKDEVEKASLAAEMLARHFGSVPLDLNEEERRVESTREQSRTLYERSRISVKDSFIETLLGAKIEKLSNPVG